jgi:hypothetical protein
MRGFAGIFTLALAFVQRGCLLAPDVRPTKNILVFSGAARLKMTGANASICWHFPARFGLRPKGGLVHPIALLDFAIKSGCHANSGSFLRGA